MSRFPLIKNNFTREDLDLVIEHLKNDDPRLTNGSKVCEFEEAWSKWLGVKYSVFVNSGSSANLLSITLLKLKYPQGGEVIVPPLTWVSDIASIIQNGFTPKFVDINFENLAMSKKGILQAINKNTRAVFLSHIQGFNALSDDLLTELNDLNIPLIEDVCESHGATHNGKKVGSFGWTSNFSFYYAHHMSTIEGGMVCTNDEEAYQNLRMLRSHGMVRECSDQKLINKWALTYPDLNPNFIFSYPSYNVRNTEIGGILGLSQLKHLDKNNLIRTRNKIRFLENLDSERFFIDFNMKGSSNYAFNLILKNKDDGLSNRLEQSLAENDIEYRKGSAGGGNQLRQPYLREMFQEADYYKNFPNTEHIHFYGYYIGNFPSLELADVDFVCNVINAA